MFTTLSAKNRIITTSFKITLIISSFFPIRSLLLSHPLAIKALVPGRLIVLNYEEQVNLIGILLSFDTSAKEKTYSVLILVDESLKGKKESKSNDKKFNDFLSLASQSVSFPGCISANHQVNKTSWQVINFDDTAKKLYCYLE